MLQKPQEEPGRERPEREKPPEKAAAEVRSEAGRRRQGVKNRW